MRHHLASLVVGFALAAVPYRPPVDAPVIDPFRAPPAPWAAGNRGLEYRTDRGTRVRAAADGDVVFAGTVASALHVVVLHADGIRTSYSFLETVLVHRGDAVEQGDAVGTSATRLHFGARVGDTYVDPAGLFLPTGPPRVRLVRDDEPRRLSESGERAALSEAHWVPTRPSALGVSRRTARAVRALVPW
jgi:murein DD-endopeptidase MepM/ murein hydrolase activator NlpD